MTKQQKQIEFNESLISSKIHQTIEQLESSLKLYQQTRNNYLIQVELLEIHQTIGKLKCQLADLSKI